MKLKQYLDVAKRILEEGKWVENDRTGKRCLTIINADFTYNVDNGEFPLVTTRKAFWKAAIAELLGYLRGYDNAADFRSIGCNTWNANANENESWLNNPHRKGEDDMGRVYGVQGRKLRVAPSDAQYDELVKLSENGDKNGFNHLINLLKDNTVDQLQKVYNNLKNGIDDRGEIITFWNSTEFEQGCLRPCMFMHHFSILDGTLYLNSYQRSCDIPLGYCFNAPQCYVLLALMARVTGLKCGKVFHKVVNAHIYEDQVDLMRDVQIKREPFASPTLHISPKIKTLDDILTWVTTDDFELTGYQHHEPIKYPFSV